MIAGRNTIIDAGAIIALLSPRDAHHAAANSIDAATLRRCVTTEAAVVEATHFVLKARNDPALVLDFLLDFDIPIVALHLPMHEDCVGLMRKYANVPMDYADASIVALADRTNTHRVFTFDRRGFEAYRDSQGRELTLIP